MKFCTKCGAQNQDESSFCTKCGTPLLPTEIPHKPNKKKTTTIILTIVSVLAVLAIILFGYVICLHYDWSEATCIEPAKCNNCGKYKDDVLGNHQWIEATCTTPKTCYWCDIEEGEALGHDWQEATCTEPQTCSRCNEIGDDALDHTEGEWELVQEPTLIDVGVEEIRCSVCSETLDSRGTEKKKPKVIGDSFNFTAEEFVDWFEDMSTLEFVKTETDSVNTTYTVYTADGETGALMLNHGENGKDGNVCAIMLYFDDYIRSVALISHLGEQIDSEFSLDDASLELFYDEIYTKAGMTALRVSLGDDTEVAILATNEALADILA